ncbi:hypothetical protein Fmac_023293 [Flemingia macrophylla]|uniref:Uncharacterized protein n=1 Tax=Flemingia macrophylla TaxID=520843 RepID=A0ABD1LL47_9FABA
MSQMEKIFFLLLLVYRESNRFRISEANTGVSDACLAIGSGMGLVRLTLD